MNKRWEEFIVTILWILTFVAGYAINFLDDSESIVDLFIERYAYLGYGIGMISFIGLLYLVNKVQNQSETEPRQPKFTRFKSLYGSDNIEKANLGGSDD